MNDQELAGAARRLLPYKADYDWAADPNEEVNFWDWYYRSQPERFVRDWRVAGALMEKMSSVHVYWDDIGWSCKSTERYITGKDTGVGNVDALDMQYHEMPRAIIEACVAALEIREE